MHPRLRASRSAPLLLLLVLALPATASADTTWTKISSDLASGITIPEIGLVGSTAVLTWQQDTSPNTADIVSDTFETSPANDVANGKPGKVADTWATLSRNQAMVPTPSGGLQIAFSGTHSTTAGDTLDGLIGSSHNADGSWTPATVIATGSGAGVWSGVLSGAVPIYVGADSGSISILVNPNSPASMRVADLAPQVPGGSGYSPKIARDSMGRVFVAWYSSGAQNGVYVQQIDGTTGQPIGAPALAPGSNDIDNNAFGVALACAVTCRVVYGDAPSGSSTDLLVSWWLGESGPTTVANLAGTGQGAGRVVSVAYRSDGRLWVAWWNGKSYDDELGDAKGAGGVVQDDGAPTAGGTGYALNVATVGDDLLMATTYNYKAGQNLFAIYVNTVAPPAPVTYAPGPRQTTLVASPGGKGFRIQVQYRVPAVCKPSCSAHAELRTRNGRQQYSIAATVPLPGDGKVVLGTRPSVKLPGGKKVRFYITISKAELKKAPFTTVGANRVANTRLRVWLKTKSGQELTVRDGRIAVSIARIKSGALPGLAGIL